MSGHSAKAVDAKANVTPRNKTSILGVLLTWDFSHFFNASITSDMKNIFQDPFFVLQGHQSLKTKHLQSAWCLASQLEFVCGDLENQLKQGDFFPSSRDFRNLGFSIQSTVTDIFCRVLPFLHAFSCPGEYDFWYERNILDMTIVTSQFCLS